MWGRKNITQAIQTDPPCTEGAGLRMRLIDFYFSQTANSMFAITPAASKLLTVDEPSTPRRQRGIVLSTRCQCSARHLVTSPWTVVVACLRTEKNTAISRTTRCARLAGVQRWLSWDCAELRSALPRRSKLLLYIGARPAGVAACKATRQLHLCFSPF